MADKMTVGKKIGFYAFVISEITVIQILIIILFDVFVSKSKLDSNIINAVLLFQGSIFTVVWGAKATSNFTKKEVKNDA
jgi:hypothetical protein